MNLKDFCCRISALLTRKEKEEVDGNGLEDKLIEEGSRVAWSGKGNEEKTHIGTGSEETQGESKSPVLCYHKLNV